MKCKEYINTHNLLKRAMIAVWNVMRKGYINMHNLLKSILFFPRRLGHDTQVTQSSHSILPCGALYKLDPLETKGLNLVLFFERMRSQTLFSRRSRMKKCTTYWKVQWICFALGGWAMILGLRNHYILFCPAGLYINWTLSKQRDST